MPTSAIQGLRGLPVEDCGLPGISPLRIKEFGVELLGRCAIFDDESVVLGGVGVGIPRADVKGPVVLTDHLAVETVLIAVRIPLAYLLGGRPCAISSRAFACPAGRCCLVTPRFPWWITASR